MNESTEIVISPRPSINKIPRVAVPSWDEIARLPKLRAVVNALKITALVVLEE